jgi:LacI family transcriptional regulator
MISQKKIAEHLKLGRSTVANILRGEGSQKYSDETRRAVLEAAERFGYRPNRASRSVRLGRSNLIGVIHFASVYETGRRMGESLSQIITERGYELFVVDLAWHGGNFQRAIDHLVESRVEGVIISQMVERFGAQEISRLTRAGIPVVALHGSDTWGVPVVFGDLSAAFRSLTQHLIEVGHRRLLLMVTHYSAWSAEKRIEGFKRGLEDACGEILPNLRSPDEVVQWPANPEGKLVGKIVRLPADGQYFDSAYDYTRRLIDAGALPDVLVCSNDQWAKGAITALLQAGLRVPEDVAVTGCDNDSFGDFAPYYLTTISQAIPENCAKVVELMIDLIQKRELPQKEYSFPCSLVVRRSCGAVLATGPSRSASSTSISLPR